MVTPKFFGYTYTYETVPGQWFFAGYHPLNPRILDNSLWDHIRRLQVWGTLPVYVLATTEEILGDVLEWCCHHPERIPPPRQGLIWATHYLDEARQWLIEAQPEQWGESEGE